MHIERRSYMPTFRIGGDFAPVLRGFMPSLDSVEEISSSESSVTASDFIRLISSSLRPPLTFKV